MEIREAHVRDRPAIRDVARRSLEASYSLGPRAITGAIEEWYGESRLRETFSDDNRLLLVADDDGHFVVETTDDEYEARGLVLATGASYETPAIADVDEYEGRGVSYCVECDAYFYRDRPVAVVGAGNYAAKEALMLLDYTDDVRVLTNGDAFDADPELADRLREHAVEVITDPVDRVAGEEELERVVLRSGESIGVDGLFVALGAAGGTDIAETLGIPQDGPYLRVDEDQSTTVDRVYAAGDLTGGNRQVATSIGEGADAAINLLESFRGTDYVDYRKLDA